MIRSWFRDHTAPRWLALALWAATPAGAASNPAADAPAAAAVDSTSPIAFLRAHDRQVTALVGSPGDSLAPAVRRQVRELINGVFDFEELSRLSLGDFWEPRTPEERREFVAVYRGIIEQQNLDRFVKYYREGKFQYRSEEVEGQRATVHAVLPLQNEEMAITYLLLRPGGAVGWRVYDLVIDGTSTAEVNQRSYARYIRRNSYEKLVEQLRSQLAKLADPS